MSAVITEAPPVPTVGLRPEVSVAASPPSRAPRRVYPWLVFAVSFALLLSDYMSRQVLSAVFPMLKTEWGLNDAQLGALTSVVAIAVGVLTVPLSLLGDRFGRVRAITLMAVMWSVATLGSALAASYGQLLLSRLLIGVGEAAYGSVGLAVVLAVFPARSRATLTGAFLAGGCFGSVLGVSLGGAIGVHFGWRWSFGTMAVLGLVLVALYRLVITEGRLARHQVPDVVATGSPAPVKRAKLSSLFSTPAVLCAYAGSGLQLFVAGSLFAWLPTYLHRVHHMPVGKAAGVAAILILIQGVGMIVCGILSDRVSQVLPIRKWTVSIVYAVASLVLLGVGFSLPATGSQLLLIALGTFFAAGTAGPTGAMVTNLTHESIRATGLGTLTLANNLLGLATGPLVVGILADAYGLATAMQIVPLVSIPVIALLLLGRRVYPSSLRRVAALQEA